jgi:anti-anti-sigma factor
MHDIDALADESGDVAGVVVETVSTPAGSTVVVSVTGEIDMLTETQLLDGLREALAQPGAAAVVIDLSGVTFFSSSGIAALATAHTTATDQGLLLHVVVPPESATYRPLQLTGMTELLTIYPTREAALGSDLSDPMGLGASDPTTGDDEDPDDPEHHFIPAG